MLVFWPDDTHSEGWAFGWPFARGRILCIAGVIQASEFSTTHLARERLSLRLDQIHELIEFFCNPCVLGHVSFKSSKDPIFSRLRLCSTSSSDADETREITPRNATIVMYRRPNARAMRFFTVDSLELETDRKSNTAVPQPTDLAETIPSLSGEEIGTIISRLNTSRNLQNAVELSDDISILTGLVPPKPQDAEPVKTTSTPTIRRRWIYVDHIWNFLKDWSSVAQQVHVRTSEVQNMVPYLRNIGNRKRYVDPEATVGYINFYNSLWLLFNDLVVGWSFGAFILENREVLSEMVFTKVEEVTILWISSALYWLDHWPLGIKLNTELSAFLSGAFGQLVELWKGILLNLRPWSTVFLALTGYACFAGMSMCLAVISDFLAIFTLHIYFGYFIMNTVYQKQLSTLYSLFNLFRGKRRNVLRNRVDSWTYDIDQLLLGTILFTLLVFLFPTVTCYHLLFALLRLTVIAMFAVADVLLAFLNHFPLGALMLRLKDSDRLPGGISFEIVRKKRIPATIFRMKNKPIPLSKVFRRHIRLWSRLGSYYNPLRLAWRLMSGQHLSQIPRSAMKYKGPVT